MTRIKKPKASVNPSSKPPAVTKLEDSPLTATKFVEDPTAGLSSSNQKKPKKKLTAEQMLLGGVALTEDDMVLPQRTTATATSAATSPIRQEREASGQLRLAGNNIGAEVKMKKKK
ncbi:hypothetical protein HDU93_004645, partial [Gonapodya sp. JEL0774]